MASAVRYRISVRGRLTERLGSAFHGMILEPAAGQTVLVGEIRLRATERTVRCPATEVNPRPPSAMPNRSRSYAPSAATPILGSTSK